MACCFVKIAVDTPLDKWFDYHWSGDDHARPEPGQLVLVPLGKRQVVGLIVEVADTTDVPEDKLRDVLAIRTQIPPLNESWRALCRFAASYYQRPLGEVALPCLPRKLRETRTRKS